MPPLLRFTFRNIEATPALEDDLRARAEELERFSDDVLSCEVIVEAPHRRHHQGGVYHVRIRLAVSGAELVVSRDPPGHQAHEDLYVAIRDAFDAARRQLEDHARRRRGAVKTHRG